MPPLLHIEGVQKRYPGVLALDNVGLDLSSGEILALVGENGAGKSTLINILAGALAADDGTIMIEGQRALIESPSDARRLGIGVIYQDLKLVPELSVAENILLGNEPSSGVMGILQRRMMNTLASDGLRQLGFSIAPATPVRTLSLAQQQIVAIARALSSRVKILALDEPTAPLTRREINVLFGILRRLKEEGTGIIYISHKLEEVFSIADRIVVMRDGRVVHESAAAELDRRTLIALMVGRELDREYPAFTRIAGEEILRIDDLRAPGVADVSLTLHRGEVLGLAGLTGAGRTELARVLFGADRRLGGSVTLAGELYEPRSPREAIRAGVGLLTEDRNRYGLLMEMTVRENVTLPTLGQFLHGLFIDRTRERLSTEDIVRRLRIKTQSIDQKITALSGGNRQKVVLARWLLTDAKVIIFDEPTTGVDVGARFEIYQIIDQLAQQGLGILVISSDLPELLGICDRIAVMHQGTVTGILPRDEATQERIMELATPEKGELSHGTDRKA